MESGWFASLGWWDQKAAYAAFDTYRNEDTRANYEHAVNLALPIIRVVYASKKVHVNYAGDEDDLISHAAFIISKALPKMVHKPRKGLDNDKKYMRYLFTCVVHAFYREYEILHKKNNKIKARIVEEAERPASCQTGKGVRQFEANELLQALPQQLYDIAMDIIRFDSPEETKICSYIMNQMIQGREIAKSVLQLMGCKDRNFFINYCQNTLFQAFIQLRSHNFEDFFREDEVDYEDAFDEYDDYDEVVYD